MTTAKIRLEYAVASVILSVILSCGFAVYYVTEQNKKWCDTLTVLTQVDPRTQIQPSTPSGQQARRVQIRTYDALARLSKGYHCEVVK